ncbi:PAAR-like domain-containing protein [Marivita sp. S0852]|uniref:PAAR-like domain-containing protein n=1 Tax=Marivita sp. S0852 TaxID=3373893 RepID=UPI003982B6A8
MSLPKDDYVGEPGYPAPWTTSVPREGLRDTDEAVIVSLAPDVCRSTSTPIPYPVVDFCGHDDGYTPSVRFTGQRAMVLRSHTTEVHGDEPGRGGGVVSGTYGGICEPIEHADQVFAEGSPVIRHLDRFHMNNRNCEGEAYFVRDMGVYAAPVDDDPLPGSLLLADASGTWTTVDYLQFAQAEPGVSGFAGVEPPATVDIPIELPTGNAPVPEGPLPPPTPPEDPPPNALQRLGQWARVLGRANILLNGDPVSNDMGYRILAQSEADRMLDGITPRTPAEQDVYDGVRERIWRHIYENYGELFGGRDEDYLQEELDYLEREIARQREAETQTETDTDTDPVRISEDYESRCPIVTIPFDTHGDPVEFSRQIEEQEARLNRMTPTEYLARRTPISPNAPGRRSVLQQRRRASLPHQDRVRAAYERENRDDYIEEHGLAAWREHFGNLAATHELDLIAGGYESEISGMGGAVENSSIGPQWRADRRSGVLDRHAEELEQNGCPFVRVDLVAQ